MGASLARRLVRHHKGIFLLVLAADSDPLNLQSESESESVQHASRLMRSPMIDVSMSRRTGLVQTCRDEWRQMRLKRNRSEQPAQYI